MVRRVRVHASQASRLEAAHMSMGSDVCSMHTNTYGERRRRVRAHASLWERDAAHTHNANNNYTVYECCTSDTPEDTFEKRNELQIQTNTCTQYAPMKTAAPFFLLPQTEAQIRDPRNGHRNLSQTWGV